MKVDLLEDKQVKLGECEDLIKIKHKKNLKLLEYLSKQFKFSNMIFDLDELADIFIEYETEDNKIKKALNPFIKKCKRFWNLN